MCSCSALHQAFETTQRSAQCSRHGKTMTSLLVLSLRLRKEPLSFLRFVKTLHSIYLDMANVIAKSLRGRSFNPRAREGTSVKSMVVHDLHNLSRTLKTFERYGFIEMVAGKRSKKPVAKSVDFDICIPAQ